jgi:recombinational DNA repair ATPase RecF
MMAKMGEQMAGAMQQQEAHVKEAFTAQAQAMQGIQQQLAQMGEAIQQLAQVVPGLAQQIQAVEAELQPLKEGVVQAIALGKSNQEVTAKLAALLASAAPQPINDDTAGITGGGLPGHPGDMAIPPGAEPLGGGVPPEMVPPPGGVPLPLGP